MTSEQPGTTRRTVLKGLALGAAACVAAGSAPAIAEPAPAPGAPRRLPRVDAEAAGVSPDGIAAFVDAVQQKVGGLHSFMLLRHGQVAAEGWWAPYAPQYRHMLFSLSKSFTSTAIGLAVAEGRLTVDAPVVSFFPDDVPARISDNLAAMRVRHLLCMGTGHDQDATGAAVSEPSGNWVKGFLAAPVEHVPGTHFVYNSAATYVLSAIVQKLTGGTLLRYLQPRLFGPLGIRGATWETCPRGINTGGWGLSVKTEDIARFGQLYLQKGEWSGRRIVPEKWVEEATSKQISNGTDPNNDWAQGYGYQFWRCRHGLYRGDGAFGQFCIVMPQHDAVLAITSGVADMGAVMSAAWDHILPALQQGPPASGAGSAQLRKKLASLAIAPPQGKPTSRTAYRVAGRTYRFEPNDAKVDSAVFAFEGSRCRLQLKDRHGEHEMQVGTGSWVRGTAVLGDDPSANVAARGAWSDADTFAATLCFYETPFIQTVTCTFAGDRVTAAFHTNVGFGPTEGPTLVGRMA